MINIFLYITAHINKSQKLIFLLLLLSLPVLAQTTSNLDQFYTLIDSVSNSMLKDLVDVKEVNLELNLGTDYSVFANRIRGKILRNGIKLFGEGPNNKDLAHINFVVDNSFVGYSQPEKNGIFGDFYTERIIELSGNYFISNHPQVKEFKLAVKDTIKVEDVEKVENRSYPFTQGDLPSEPFFSSLLEPIVAIGAAAVTIFLFFSVRSK